MSAQPARERVLDWLAAGNEAPAARMRGELGLTREAAYMALASLEAADLAQMSCVYREGRRGVVWSAGIALDLRAVEVATA